MFNFYKHEFRPEQKNAKNKAVPPEEQERRLGQLKAELLTDEPVSTDDQSTAQKLGIPQKEFNSGAKHNAESLRHPDDGVHHDKFEDGPYDSGDR